MFATIGQYITGKVVTAILIVSGGTALIVAYKHPEYVEIAWKTLMYVLVWLGFVAILPWATFFVTPWVVSRESNLAAGSMLAGYLLVDVLFAFWLMGGIGQLGILIWAVLVLGFLSAGVYNFKVCEYQTERAEERL